MGTYYSLIIMFKDGKPNTRRQAGFAGEIRQQLKEYLHLDYSEHLIDDTVIISGTQKNLDEGELVAVFNSLNWLSPETLQVLVRSDHDETYSFMEFERPPEYKDPPESTTYDWSRLNKKDANP